ncbi:MAG: hypothetical protein J6Q85_03385 [Clostridia bacterium]|nr:hypothetical protein [Clostridia bacterium]
MKRKNNIFKILAVAAITVMALTHLASANELEPYTTEASEVEGRLEVCESVLALASEPSDSLGTASIEVENGTLDGVASSEEGATEQPPVYSQNGSYASKENIGDASEPTEDADDEDGVEKAEGENVFTQIYEYLCAYSGDIFGALAFITSLILSFLYKNKLVPTISKGNDRVEKELKRLCDAKRDTLDELRAENETLSTGICELKRAQDESALEVRSALEKIKSTGELITQKDNAMLVISSQVDLLYDIFMASSMPQYQKEKIGIQIAKMKEKLAENE